MCHADAFHVASYAKVSMSVEPNAFAQELIDLVLNELREDIPTLRSCLLVSRAFVPTSRIHLFSRIRLEPPQGPNVRKPNRCQSFYNLLTTSPHLSSYVKHLEIIEGLSPRSWELALLSAKRPQGYTWMADDQRLPLLLPLLWNLTSISLGLSDSRSSLDWQNVSPTVKDSLRAVFALPGLTSIRLRDIDGFSDYAELISFISKSPQLRDLSVLNVFARNDTTSDGSGVRPQLDSLAIACCYRDSFVPYICTPQSVVDISRVRELRIFAVEQDCIQRLVDATQEALEHLEIWSQEYRACLYLFVTRTF